MSETTPPAPFEGQAAFDALSAALADAVIIVGSNGAVTYSGPGVSDVVGFEPDDVVGRPLLDLVHPDDAVQVEADPFWLAPPPYEREVRMRNARGTWSWVRVQSSRIRADGSTPASVREVVGDGTLLFLRDRFEGTIRDASDLIQRALDAVNNLVVIADARLADTPLVVVNQNFLDTTGYERHEVVGQNCRFLQVQPDGTRDEGEPGDEQYAALEKVRTAVERGGSTDVVLRNYRKGGELFYNRLYISPVHDAAGQVTHFVGVQNDVTEEVAQTRRAEGQRSQLESFFESAPFLMGVLELRDGELLHRAANSRATTFFSMGGAAFDAADGRSMDDAGFTDKEAAVWRRHVEASAASGEPVRFKTAFPWGGDPDADDTRNLDVVVNGASSDAPLFSYVASDVTERRAAEHERRLLKAAVDQAAESILVTDHSPNPPGPAILYANEAHQRIFGYEPGEVLGQSPRMFQGPKSDRGVLDRVRRKIEAGERVRAEVVNYRKDGSEFVLEWEIAPVRDAAGAITNWVGTQRDVTEQRRLEHEVLEAAGVEQERMARELHDGLGQILTGSTMKLEVLRRALVERGEDDLAADAARTGELVAQALDQARAIARGLFPVSVEPDGLLAALQRLCEDANENMGVDATLVFDAPVLVGSSETAGHLYRIAQEAMTNAVRHGKARNVVVTLSHEGGGVISLAVQDDGEGISDEALEEAAGLGLRTMAYRARRVGGDLDVRSLDGGGTAVRVRFVPRAGGGEAATV